MRNALPFVLGHVIGAFAVGAGAAAFLNFKATLGFSILLTTGAAASALVCRWWPGYDAPSWRLWLAACVANPLWVVAVGSTIGQYECLLGWRSGLDCLFADLGPLVALACMPSPLLGLALRWLVARLLKWRAAT